MYLINQWKYSKDEIKNNTGTINSNCVLIKNDIFWYDWSITNYESNRVANYKINLFNDIRKQEKFYTNLMKDFNEVLNINRTTKYIFVLTYTKLYVCELYSAEIIKVINKKRKKQIRYIQYRQYIYWYA